MFISASAPRVLIYSHDTFGLGHLRRCRTLAHAIVDAYRDASVLILSGSPLIASFDFHPRVDFVRIPGVIKLEDGNYRPLGETMDIDGTIRLRRQLIERTAAAYAPDVVVVDKEPLGLRGEMESTLLAMKARGARLILGLRDILDDPSLLRPEWRRKNAASALETLYDEIWIYGLERMYRPLEGLGLPASVREKTVYTGYLPREKGRSGLSEAPEYPYLLAMTGGGGDGAALVDWVLSAYEAEASLPLPLNIVLGPFMTRDVQDGFRTRARDLPQVTVRAFDPHIEALAARSAGIIAMGGYNTFCEILSFDKPALIVPRTAPRREQLLRAQVAGEFGLVRMLTKAENRSPDHGTSAMIEALRRLPDQPKPSSVAVLGLLAGLNSINERLKPWLTRSAEPLRASAGGA